MLGRGKIAVLAILGLALAMAAFAWWWNRQQGRRSLEFWGKEGALAIRDAPQVELIKLIPFSADEPDNTAGFRTPGGGWKGTATKDLGSVQGLGNARHALLEDASFQWEQPLDIAGADWQYAVRFRGEEETTVLFDFRRAAIGSWEQKRATLLSPKTMKGWKQFLDRHISDLAPAGTK